MRRALAVLAAAFVVVGAVVAVRTAGFRSKQLEVGAAPAVGIDPGAADRLAAALRFATVSYQDAAQFDGATFTGFQRHLRESFPLVHRTLEQETVADWSLLYRWRGRNTSLAPVLLLAHQDVVPVERGTEAQWTHPPFAGVIADGFVWGRGAMDDKVSVLGILEAVETLLRAHVEPVRTIYLAFGHDEEVGGVHGAAALAARLAERGVAPDYVLDEGLPIGVDMVPGVDAPVAMIGVGEKGYLSLEMTVDGEGGHSSMPPAATPVGVLAAALAALERHQMQPALRGPTRHFFEAVGPEMPLPLRAVFANLWITAPLVVGRLTSTPPTNATVRTTTAPTMLEGSVKENVLPARARAVVNFRILPGDSVAGVVEHARATIGDDRVRLRALTDSISEPSPESPTDAPAFVRLARTVRAVFPGAVVAPALVLGATDSRRYRSLSPNVYRFLPWHATTEDLHRVHGTNERIGVGEYAGAVRFYATLMRAGD